MPSISQRLRAEGGRKANPLVLWCCGAVASVWICVHLLVPGEDVAGYGVCAGDPVYLPLQFVTYSFMHSQRWVLIVNLVMLVLVGEVLAHCLSVLAFVRLYSFAAALCALVHLAICWSSGTQATLSGGHPVLMSWCTSMFILNPGRLVGENVRGPLVVFGAVFFVLGSLADVNNVQKNALTMAVGALAGLAYALAVLLTKKMRR